MKAHQSSCQRCGTVVGPDEPSCPDCGAIRLGVLELKPVSGPGHAATVRIRTPVGRGLLGRWSGAATADGLGDPQFVLDPDPATGWTLRASSARARTAVNGVEIPAGSSVVLRSGDIISVTALGSALTANINRRHSP